MPDIKRYPNRKLYDTDAKRYVTLEDIAEMIRSGQDIHVTDHESGDDLTTLTLTQIILEQEKKASGFLPRSLLTSLIRTGGDTLEQVVRSLQATLIHSDHVDASESPSTEETAKNEVTGGDVEQSAANEVHGADRGADRGEDRSTESTSGSVVDERVSDMLHLLNVPTRRDVRRLQEQLNLLSSRLEELSSEQREVEQENDDPEL
jgi:polyhydroxyalkanoate synthesis repressor PhaR